MPKFARPNSYTGKQSNQKWTGDVRSANSNETSAGDSKQLYVSPYTLANALPVIDEITVTGDITTTAGDFVATDGDLILTAAGNKLQYGSVATTTAAGANSAGTVTLVAGTATIATTAVTANSLIRLTRQSVGSTGANDLGILSVGTIVAGTSFIINAWTVTDATALQTDDVSVIFWELIN